MTSVSIIVPAYNEGDNIRGAVSGVMVAAAAARLDAFEILIVNDGSTDWTASSAALVQKAFPKHVRVLTHATNRGLRAAYETGLAAASLPYTVWFPGDGEMAAESIESILRAVGTADLVIPYHGTPERRAWFRRLLTWGSTTQLNVLLDHDLHYYQGTVVYPTDLARRLPRTTPGFFCMAEMLAHALEDDPSYVQVPLVHVERSSGVSKAVSWRAIWNAQKHIVRIWWRLRVVPGWDVLRYATTGPL